MPPFGMYAIMAIADFRLGIADGHWKELPHHFFNRQSAISNRQSAAPEFYSR
ncbi:MAG: hypothetical protein ABSE93_03410 [Terriglobia bacterium]|jgi:hypothetical protein